MRPAAASTAVLTAADAEQGRGRATIILGSVLALVIAAIAAFAFLWRDRPEDLRAGPPVAEAPQAPPGRFARSTSGSEERQAPSGRRASRLRAPRQEVAVAQRAVLYEEDPANPQTPKAQVGRVPSGASTTSIAGQGQPLETGGARRPSSSRMPG